MRVQARNRKIDERCSLVAIARLQRLTFIRKSTLHDRSTRPAITTVSEHRDQATADLFTRVSRTVDKNFWFMETNFQN